MTFVTFTAGVWPDITDLGVTDRGVGMRWRWGRELVTGDVVVVFVVVVVVVVVVDVVTLSTYLL